MIVVLTAGIWSLRFAHGYVHVLEDLAGSDAQDAVARFNQVVTFASAVLTAEMIGEAETGTELFGSD